MSELVSPAESHITLLEDLAGFRFSLPFAESSLHPGIRRWPKDRVDDNHAPLDTNSIIQNLALATRFVDKWDGLLADALKMPHLEIMSYRFGIEDGRLRSRREVADVLNFTPGMVTGRESTAHLILLRYLSERVGLGVSDPLWIETSVRRAFNWWKSL